MERKDEQVPEFQVLVERLIKSRLIQVEFQARHLRLEKQPIKTISINFLRFSLEDTRKETKHQIQMLKVHISMVCLQ